MSRRLHNLKNILPRHHYQPDTIKESIQLNNDSRGLLLLAEAQQYWDNMFQFRRERERNKRYTYGKQWDDTIVVDCKRMSEEEYIISQGNLPLKNNLIRRLVRNVIGVFRSQMKEPSCIARDRDEQMIGETMNVLLQYNMQLNRMSEVYARTLEDYMIGGFVVHRKWFGWRDGKTDCWTDYVNPNRFFINTNVKDFRGWDVSFLGEIHDISFNELCSQFAHTPKEYQQLSEVYSSIRSQNGKTLYMGVFGKNQFQDYSMLECTDQNLCRVIEIWRKESKPRYRCHDYNTGEIFKVEVEDFATEVSLVNAKRREQGLASGLSEEEIPYIRYEWFIDSYWYNYYITPTGLILSEGETKYYHDSHPYVFKAYPFIDGEIHSFVSDVIDQQRYVNRLISLQDWIMRASAKGVLLVPEDCIPDDMDLQDFADTWSKFNGVIAYKPKPGIPAPQQVSNNSTNIGIGELLQVQLRFFEDISGVHGALQGKAPSSGVSGSLYAQQAQNASTSLLDLLDSFSQFVIDAAYKDVKNIQQYYDLKRVFNIAGKDAALSKYDPQKIFNCEFDFSVTESASSPTYRSMANDFLMQIWERGQINLKQLLEVGNFPFADKLLQVVEADAQSGEGMHIDEVTAQQVAQAGNPQASEMLYNALANKEGGIQ